MTDHLPSKEQFDPKDLIRIAVSFRRTTSPQFWNRDNMRYRAAKALLAFARRLQTPDEPPKTRKCHANMYSDPPQDCDAPFCGCNPAWDDCIEMLQECELLIDRNTPPAAPKNDDVEFLRAVIKVQDDSGTARTDIALQGDMARRLLAEMDRMQREEARLANRLAQERQANRELARAAEPPAATRYWEYLDKYAADHVVEVSAFLTTLMCNYADDGRDDKASLVGTAVDFVSQWVMMQRLSVTKEPSLAERQHELPDDAKGVLYSRMRELQRPADGVPLDKREHQPVQMLPLGDEAKAKAREAIGRLPDVIQDAKQSLAETPAYAHGRSGETSATPQCLNDIGFNMLCHRDKGHAGPCSWLSETV